MRLLRFIPIILALVLAGCNDEPEPNDSLPFDKLIQAVCEYDDVFFNSPTDPPEYIIISSARDIAELPEGTIADSSEYVYSRVDFAKNTLVIVTSVVYCEPKLDEDDRNWATAEIDLKRGYLLDVKYSNCSVFPSANYSLKCKIQFAFITDKIPDDTIITITESMIND